MGSHFVTIIVLEACVVLKNVKCGEWMDGWLGVLQRLRINPSQDGGEFQAQGPQRRVWNGPDELGRCKFPCLVFETQRLPPSLISVSTWVASSLSASASSPVCLSDCLFCLSASLRVSVSRCPSLSLLHQVWVGLRAVCGRLDPAVGPQAAALQLQRGGRWRTACASLCFSWGSHPYPGDLL